MRYYIFLRSINVGKYNRIKMLDLKLLLDKYEHVETYIQSGNIMIETTQEINSHIIENLLLDAKIKTTAFILNDQELLDIINSNPYIDVDNKVIHITLFNKNIDLEIPEIHIFDNYVIQYCPDGYSSSKYTNKYFETKIKCDATTRNLDTIKKTLELMS